MYSIIEVLYKTAREWEKEKIERDKKGKNQEYRRQTYLILHFILMDRFPKIGSLVPADPEGIAVEEGNKERKT